MTHQETAYGPLTASIYRSSRPAKKFSRLGIVQYSSPCELTIKLCFGNASISASFGNSREKKVL